LLDGELLMTGNLCDQTRLSEMFIGPCLCGPEVMTNVEDHSSHVRQICSEEGSQGGGTMLKMLKYTMWFGIMAGIGILLGCYIHGKRVNQTTVMSGVAFVREWPYGEQIVGYIETTVFSWQEKKNLEEYKEKHPNIRLNPEVLKQHEKLYGREQMQKW
jgi:hypothetical protein